MLLCTVWHGSGLYVQFYLAVVHSVSVRAQRRTRMTSCVARHPRMRASWEWLPAPMTRTSAAQAAWVHPPSPSRNHSSPSSWTIMLWWTTLVFLSPSCSVNSEASEDPSQTLWVGPFLYFEQRESGPKLYGQNLFSQSCSDWPLFIQDSAMLISESNSINKRTPNSWWSDSG